MLGSSKETRGARHAASTWSHLKLPAAIKACCALAFSRDGFKHNATLYLPVFFIPRKWDSFKNIHEEELLMPFYTWGWRGNTRWWCICQTCIYKYLDIYLNCILIFLYMQSFVEESCLRKLKTACEQKMRRCRGLHCLNDLSKYLWKNIHVFFQGNRKNNIYESHNSLSAY